MINNYEERMVKFMKEYFESHPDLTEIDKIHIECYVNASIGWYKSKMFFQDCQEKYIQDLAKHENN